MRARWLYEGYPDHDLLSVRPPYRHETVKMWYQRCRNDLPKCGDGLFRFVVAEVAEDGEDEHGRVTADSAIHVLQRAMDDILRVIINIEEEVALCHFKNAPGKKSRAKASSARAVAPSKGKSKTHGRTGGRKS